MQDEKGLLSEYNESPNAGMAQGFNEPSPTEPITARALPQSGESLHGERMSPLPNSKEDFKVVDAEEPHQPGVEELVAIGENVVQSFAGAAGGVAGLAMGGLDAAPASTSSMSNLPLAESPMDVFRTKFGGEQ